MDATDYSAWAADPCAAGVVPRTSDSDCGGWHTTGAGDEKWRISTAVVAEQRELLARIHEDSEAIAGPIRDLAASIQFQDITRQQLEHVSRAAEGVASHLTDMAAAIEAGERPPSGGIEACLAGMYDSYVMAKQRNAHHGCAAEGKGSLIELF